MNDATEWIDPELVAAGKLLQSRGLVAPDRTQAPLSDVRAAVDRIGAFLGEGSIPLQRERDLTLPGPRGQVPCRLPGRQAMRWLYSHNQRYNSGRRQFEPWRPLVPTSIRASGSMPTA